MAYQTGQVASFSNLLSTIQDVCVLNGWTLDQGILSKDGTFVRLSLAAEGNTNGILVQAGTGSSGGSLVSPSPVVPRMGRPTTAEGSPWQSIQWPAVYHIHLHAEPDEVFVILNFNVTFFYFLAFGRSSVDGLPGSGVWSTGTVCTRPLSAFDGLSGVGITPEGGTVDGYRCCGAPFWAPSQGQISYMADTIQTEADGSWTTASGPKSLLGVGALAPLIRRSPNVWNGESTLIPLKAYQQLDAEKVRLVLDMAHARYVRVANLAPGDVITLGTDQWRVYPFYRKNSDVPDGGYPLSHSGTFGWAIRYDGD